MGSMRQESPGPVALQQGRLYDSVAIAILSLSFLLSVTTAPRLDLSRFLLSVAAHAAWYAVYHFAFRSDRPRDLWRDSLLLAAIAVANMFLVLAGLGFDWMIGLLTTGALLSGMPPAIAAGFGAAMFAATMFSLIPIGGWRSVVPSGFQIAAAYIFTVIFIMVTRRERAQRERVEQLLSDLTASKRELEAAHAQLAASAGAVEELAVTRERNRLAREIHDTLGHYLTILAIKLETSVHLFERSDPHLGEEIASAQQVTRQCLADVRQSVAALRPGDPAPLALAEAVGVLAAEYEAACPGVAVTLDCEGALHDLAPEVRLALYRCAQEALTNARKHAQATKVLVRLRVEGDRAELTVLDDGTGSGDHAAGFGLVGMRERLALLGGTLTAGPAAGQGWRVEAVIPLPQHAPAKELPYVTG
jgi:signal transduction histidine kinase